MLVFFKYIRRVTRRSKLFKRIVIFTNINTVLDAWNTTLLTHGSCPGERNVTDLVRNHIKKQIIYNDL